MPSEPSDVQHDRVSDLHGAVVANQDATWGDTKASRGVVPGIISGDVGPKGVVSAQLRGLSRVERATYGEVPSGAVTPGTGRFLLAFMLGVVVVIVLVVALVIWIST